MLEEVQKPPEARRARNRRSWWSTLQLARGSLAGFPSMKIRGKRAFAIEPGRGPPCPGRCHKRQSAPARLVRFANMRIRSLSGRTDSEASAPTGTEGGGPGIRRLLSSTLLQEDGKAQTQTLERPVRRHIASDKYSPINGRYQNAWAVFGGECHAGDYAMRGIG